MEKILEELGLTKNEAKTYLTLLRLGETKTGSLVKESKISSSKIYQILENLKVKGLVSHKLVGKIKFFRATDPNQLHLLLKEEKKEIAKKEEQLSNLLPQLNSLYSSDDEKRVEFFEGMKGVRVAHNILFSKAKKNSELKYFFPYTRLNDEQDLFYKKLWLDHENLKLKSRGLSVTAVKEDSTFQKIVDDPCIRFVDFPLPGTIDILEDSLLILSWTKTPTAILITSKEIVKHFENYFESIWKIAKK